MQTMDLALFHMVIALKSVLTNALQPNLVLITVTPHV